MASPISGITEETEAAFLRFDPEGAQDMRDFFDDLPSLFEGWGGQLKKLADRLGAEKPIHPDVVERLRELGASLAGEKDAADELNTLFKNRHAPDLERHDAPRAGEKAWNVDA